MDSTCTLHGFDDCPPCTGADLIDTTPAPTVRVYVAIRQLEPGSHFCRKTIGEISRAAYSLPLSECQEVRPDWGEYRPITTYPAIERALTRRGAFNYLPSDQQYFFWIDKQEATIEQTTQS